MFEWPAHRERAKSELCFRWAVQVPFKSLPDMSAIAQLPSPSTAKSNLEFVGLPWRILRCSSPNWWWQQPYQTNLCRSQRNIQLRQRLKPYQSSYGMEALTKAFTSIRIGDVSKRITFTSSRKAGEVQNCVADVLQRFCVKSLPQHGDNCIVAVTKYIKLQFWMCGAYLAFPLSCFHDGDWNRHSLSKQICAEYGNAERS